ncbi:MAG: isoleucine--tRNA ligase [Chloroflexi bacterium RIFCSPLOWO2_12_FULL_71_12]|nr:MAG: isoleucine--tRNA ligase [Chloroflexi bacterium RIFCSPLOWO2_12_FULL_71_12]
MAVTGRKTRFAAVGSGFDLPELEHRVLDLWEREKSFEALRKQNEGKPVFSFIDGPITANAEAMGIHHAWARTYKDVFQRYKAMQGFDQRYQNGFDCHGLWVEVEVERELGLGNKRDIERYGVDRFSEACRARVDRSAAAFTKESRRLGQWMDWEDSYFTYTDTNVSHIWEVLRICHERGWLYKGHRSMPWCARCGTAISQHELALGYRDMTHKAVFVRFPVTAEADGAGVRGADLAKQRASFLVWTTTPWTLAANVAVAVHPDLEYALARRGDEVLIMSRGTFGSALRDDAELLGTLKGRDLVGLRFRGPFDGELPAAAEAVAGHKVIPWEDVGEAEGTGIVHIAPGCGEEDFALSKPHELPVIVPIDDMARYRPGFAWLEGKDARDVADEIAADLERRGLLLRSEPYTHRYPECWRCHEELVFRVADEWFISMAELRPRMIAAAREGKWVPPHAGPRMENWLQNMGDWNISRKRYWGLPLPFYTCTNGHFFVLGSQDELRRLAKGGLDQLKELHRPWIDRVVLGCPECGADAERVKEVGDCWLDAGVVPFSTLRYQTDRAYWEKWFPAEYVVEMVEQVRLWFYSMLFFSTVVTGKAPYRAVQTFEPMMDATGGEFHKTGENVVLLSEIMERSGADAVRWMVARERLDAVMLFSTAALDAVKRHLLTFWNVYSFFVTYAEAEGFDPRAPAVPVADRPVMDRWLLSTLHRLVRDSRAALDEYDVRRALLGMEQFWEDLSVWYVRRSRPRFWGTQGGGTTLAAQQTLYEALTTLTRLFAPVMPFFAESLYQGLARDVIPGSPASVHHTRYPTADETLIDDDLERRMAAVRRAVTLGHAARSAAGVKVRMPLPRLVAVFDGTDHDRGLLDGTGELAAIVRDELNVKAFEVRDDAEGLVREIVKPDLRALGPKLGKELPKVRAALAEGRYERRDGTVVVEGHTLEPAELLISHEGTPGHAVGRDAGLVVALETTLTPELEVEGLARELVRKVNEMRKDAGLEIADRITLRYGGWVGSAIEKYGDLVASETLATSVTSGLTGAGHRWSGELNGVTAELELEKVAA